MDPIVEMHRLGKVYRRHRREDVVAVEALDLDLGVPGTVHGFLGPNGSGKTTTIRCALGLIRPTQGSVRVFGVDSATGFHQVAPRVGAIVESPKMFPNFTGRRNLSLLADLGGIDRRQVDRVLEVVGLADRDRDRFGTYSLGMRQRLAIAGALLKDPDLLILDEPANGLDPAGIAEMRVLIRQIAEQGKAVLVSSHQLAEIEQICDDVTIINRGRLVQTGRLDHIRSFAGQDQVVVTIADRDGAVAALKEAGIAAFPRPSDDELMVDIAPERSPDVTRALAERGRYLSGLRFEQASLERAFLNLTGDAPPPPGVVDTPDAVGAPGAAAVGPPPPGALGPPGAVPGAVGAPPPPAPVGDQQP
jgi:ABC-type multidrug transport system ATPase subunit